MVRFIWGVVAFCSLVSQPCLGDEDGTKLAPVFAQQVDRRLDVPEAEQRAYAGLLAQRLSAEKLSSAQYVLIVDRSEFVQALLIYWMSADYGFHFIGASPVSTA
jgi:hypothetical protein